MTVILPAGRVYALAHHKLMPTSCWGQRLRAFTTCRHALYANSSSSFRSRIVENVGGFLRPPLIQRPFFFYFRFSSSPPHLRLITPPLFSSAVLYTPNVPTLLFVATCKTRTANRPSSAISSPNIISLFFLLTLYSARLSMTQERTASRPSGTVTFRMDSANSGDEALLVDAPTDQVGEKKRKRELILCMGHL